MTDTRTLSTQRSGLTTGSRWALAILAGLFTLGALGQFFLVGISFFDDASRWSDHKSLGHAIGVLPYVMWLPAVLGRTGGGMIGATIALFVLYMAQYGFIEADSSMVNALHPLNGSVLLVLGFWIAQRAVGMLRRPSEGSVPSGSTGAGRATTLERSSST